MRKTPKHSFHTKSNNSTRRHPQEKITDEEIAHYVPILGNAATARKFGLSERQLYARVKVAQERLSQKISSPMGPGGVIKQFQASHVRIPLTVPNGIVVVFGDCHYWPGPAPFMHTALVMLLRRFREQKKLRAVIANGDVCDFARMSRWPLINWEKQPSAREEIETAQDRLQEIADAAGNVPKLWPGGNHDIRFNKFIAEHAPELEGVPGTHLKDFFPLWQPCWSVLINPEHNSGATMVTHRMRGGKYAIQNNIIKTGVHIVTNHLHAANIWAEDTLRGRLWGVDTGCIAEINSPQFLYLEDNPVSWREAFCVLEYEGGALHAPELVLRHEEKRNCVVFRGETIKVK